MSSTNTAGRNREVAGRTVPDTRAGGASIRRGGACVTRSDHRLEVWLWGEQDMSNLDILHLALAEAIADDSADSLDVAVDLADVEFMGCSTVGALVHARAILATSNRHLTVHSPRPSSRRLLELCGVAHLLSQTPAAPGHRAVTALGTWVEVPVTPRQGQDASQVQIDTVSITHASSKQ